MVNYKEILLFCSDSVYELVTSKIFCPGIKFIYTKDFNIFRSMLDDINPAGIIISCTESLGKAMTDVKDIIGDRPAAVVIEKQDQTCMIDALNTGFTKFVCAERIKEDLSPFLDGILISSGHRQETLVKLLKRLRALGEHAKDGIIILDDLHVISFANVSACDILGKTSAELNGSPFSSVIKDHPFEDDISQKGSQIAEEFTYVNEFGDGTQIDITYSPIYEDKRFAGAVVIFSKVSVSNLDRKQELELLKYQQMYNSTQQNMAFKKQMLILKDDMSNIKAGEFKIETYFKPLDILSGDIYGSIDVGDGKYLFYIIDAMGKGLSASITALQSTSFINHSLEFSISKNDFNLNRTITSFLTYIKERLMDEEALCCVFALLDINAETMTIANYGMPPVIVIDSNNEAIDYRPNNLPIMKYYSQHNLDVVDLKPINKIIITSDGLVESETLQGGLYMDHLKSHLKKAVTKKHFLSYVNKHIKGNEDDLTFFFIKRDLSKKIEATEYLINSSTKEVSQLMETLGDRMDKDNVPITDKSTIEFALTEILINAMEHGNLGIGCDEKQKMIQTGVYDDIIEERTQSDTDYFNRKIRVKYKYIQPEENEQSQVIISISDEGDGFVASNLFKYHTFDGNLCQVDKESYNGRGIFISDNLLDGLYYNMKGNSATLLKLIDPD